MSASGITIPSCTAMLQLGALLASNLQPPALIFLCGDLGAGKTTLVRGVLRALGWQQAVKSPTYTLVESYLIGDKAYHHFDLYRLADPEELAFLGFRDYLSAESVCFIEWPERGSGLLPVPDLEIAIEYTGKSRRIKFSGRLEAALADSIKKYT